MKKFLLTLATALVFYTTGMAQETLKFSQIILVTNNQQTVPDGKVWKITALSGASYNICVPDPAQISNTWRLATVGSGFVVNGTNIYGDLQYSSNSTRYSNNVCSSASYCCDNIATYSINTNPYIVPMWLPAGTTVSTLSANVFLSVIEFAVTP